MSEPYNSWPFARAAVAAFPPLCQVLAEEAAEGLAPFVDAGYRKSSLIAVVLGKPVHIPQRIHFVGRVHVASEVLSEPWFAANCLQARSTDGYARHASLRHLLYANRPWTVPFVVLLAGEYVVEIIEDMVSSLSTFDRQLYVDFVRENRGLMLQLHARATSYWDCYYRAEFPDKRAYPGLVFLHQLELWGN
ncbi:MAG TPA: hypothetical protein VGU23_08260 [Acidobacteriaceae bacterium]|nr:hypothetical protein [Acidobacteriaceae bacterium]